MLITASRVLLVAHVQLAMLTQPFRAYLRVLNLSNKLPVRLTVKGGHNEILYQDGLLRRASCLDGNVAFLRSLSMATAWSNDQLI